MISQKCVENRKKYQNLVLQQILYLSGKSFNFYGNFHLLVKISITTSIRKTFWTKNINRKFSIFG